ncbi:hypothetical protein BJX99DRAFT_255735 [Aspergillus californicus]
MGHWGGIAPNHAGDVSTSAEAYLVLKIRGMNSASHELRQAQAFIQAASRLEKIRMFTLNIYKLAFWARSNVVPLLLIAHHRPLHALPNGRSPENTFLDEFWLEPAQKSFQSTPASLSDPISLIFTLIDKKPSPISADSVSPRRAATPGTDA